MSLSYMVGHSYRKRRNLSGRLFGRLSAIGLFSSLKSNPPTWLCRCACGNFKIVSGYCLESGHTKSCGCLYRENGHIQGKKNRKYSIDNERFYRVWCGIRDRCDNKNNLHYHNYGGRGIKVCGRWYNYQNFIDDMYKEYVEHKETYPKNTTLDRIDNDGDYTLVNCRWITRQEQANNTRKLREFIATRTSDGFKVVAKNQARFAREYNLSQHSISCCLRNNLLVDREVPLSYSGWVFEYR